MQARQKEGEHWRQTHAGDVINCLKEAFWLSNLNQTLFIPYFP